MITLNTQYQAKSYNQRIRHIIIHYTAVPLDEALYLLTETQVSAHYLISADKQPQIYALVDETNRAWHAGQSYWQGSAGLNDSSIGIELDNLGFIEKNSEKKCEKIWHPFPTTQITTLIELLLDLQSRYGISPTHILGHSDIAPGRKWDPGARFPWELLYKAGIGAWPDAARVTHYQQGFEKHLPPISWLQTHLQTYGYHIDITGEFDTMTKIALNAFQLHFRQDKIDGQFDAETAAILASLIERYFPHVRSCL